jgi:membrane protein required for colicin V production
MNILDLYILIPVLAGFVTGLFRGLIKEVISLAIIFAGIYLSKTFSGLVADWMVFYFEVSEKAAQPLAFISIFILIAIILGIFGKIAHRLINMLSLGFLNAIVGGIFGGLKLALLLSILLNLEDAFKDKIDLIDAETKEKSMLYQPAKNLAPQLWEEITTKEETDVEL